MKPNDQPPSIDAHYRSLNMYLRERFGEKVYKLALDGGFICPTRDGTLGTRGCIFCAGGSGAFAQPVGEDVRAAIETAKKRVSGKGGKKFIAYYQSYTGTYAPLDRLRTLYTETVSHPDIVALSIGTRPDCLPDETVALLKELNRVKPVWTELGLQTVHEATARYIRRGYPLAVFDDAVRRLHEAGIEVVVHMILGLPGETPEMTEETARYIGRSGAEGIKFQLLHVLEGTDLAEDYRKGLFPVLTQEAYIRVLERCIEAIPADMVVHRLTGDGAKRELIAPLWSADKKQVLNAINRAFDRDAVMQGRTV
ncbi:MAG: TIGR01212 family radical SAM protein [Oscillospiraceae bacterium]|nr:TIGR01212 family radical SAM protein [Oscillospiraceae bacterium]